MRIRRNLASHNSSNDVASTCSDPPGSNHRNPIPRRCSSAATTTCSLVCTLSRSPWDVADPSSSQLEGGLFSLTGTSTAVPDAPRSVGSSEKLSGDKKKRLNGADSDRENDAGLKASPGKIRASGIRSYSSQPSVEKQQRESNTETVPKRRGRPVKKPSANAYEFYYYSGFGPHWGKKRGSTGSEPASNTIVGVEKESSPSPGIGFVDYGEDEDEEDDDDENGETGRRRGGRKRVKARSLKSLM
uniref:Uncharacterized protein n=1 Tax=Kalanchoe fedtschenkoi TaxID=63787 RepID=A0A7N0TVX0_KALFE